MPSPSSRQLLPIGNDVATHRSQRSGRTGANHVEKRDGTHRAVVPPMSATGKIRLLHEVGRGSTATVWAAHHAGLGRKVAVKCVSAERLAEYPDEVARLAREAWIGARLRSPHAVRILAHAQRQDASYLVMEWSNGETLEEHLRARGPLELVEVDGIVRQVASLLAEAHGLGIVHRDIKPTNLLVTDRADGPFVEVLDFGIAALLTEPSPPAGRVLGTPLYMSPERFTGTAERDPRADLWSLAVVAYRALTGVHPFSGKTLADVAVAVQGTVVPPSQLRSSLPPSVDVWFARAFARDVACRFQTPASMSASLSRAVDVSDEATSVAIDVDWAPESLPSDELDQTIRMASFEGPRPVARGDCASASPPDRLATVA